jgi:hypothetical protein
MDKRKIDNKKIYELLMELGSNLADKNFVWPNELRRKFERITSWLLKH